LVLIQKRISVSVGVIITALVAFVMSAVLTGLTRKFALMHGVLDVPNERSSHSIATPRGGGLAIVSVANSAMLVLGWLGDVKLNLLMALSAGVAVAAIGFVDDRRSVRAGIRFAVHTGAALWAVLWLGGLPPLRIGEQILQLGWAGNLLALMGIVWILNLFNFMDGIDGLAASEAVFVACAGAALGLMNGRANEVSAVGSALGATCCGFLLWNWPPAKIFMGDVGSGYLGYTLAVLALAAARDNPVALWIWLLLGGAFFVDATVTLVRRLMRGEPVYEAHRSHGYQWLARRWGSHLRVTVATMSVNVLLLLPCALLAALRPRFASWIALGVLIAGGVAAFAAGSGRRERPR
jgi:Fuc2NAc and GlcNAc transferase